ncbi:MAG: extracellular solute-binding protein, partial [Ruthenibacterium sp.]
KKVLSIVLALALTLSLAACGGAASSTAKSTAVSTAASTAASAPAEAGAIEEGATLVYWPMWSETEPQGQVISAAIDAFTAETGVEVEVNWAGGRDTRKTLSPALDNGETIDVFDEDVERVNGTWGKYILDIQSMYDASPLNGKQNATLINLAKELGGGSLKSVPYQPSTFQVMYNKAAFEKAKITAVPTTWDELMAACEALKGAGVIPFTVDDAYMAAMFGYFMDRIVGFDTTKAVAGGDFTNAAVLETAKVFEDMVKKGYIDPRAAGNAFPAGQSTIANGEVAMYLNGTWLPNEIKKETPPDFKWGTFALPNCKEGGDGAESNQFGSQCFAINKDSKFPNAAFALIQYLTSGEWDQKLATDTLGVPMANDATWPDALVDAKACLDATTNRLTWAVDMENDANVNATIKENLAKLINGTTDAQGFADAFAKVQKAA